MPGIVEIAQDGRYLSKKHGFLVIQEKDTVYGEVPLDDIGLLLLSAHGVSMSKAVLASLAERGAISVLCGDSGLPVAMVVPVQANYEMAVRVVLQVKASLPLKKRLWQAVVSRKIQNQALVLYSLEMVQEAKKLYKLADEVQSGDPENKEAQAARIYWPLVFGESFRRDPDGDWPNSGLNYCYAVLRSMTARALYCAGLNPVFGIHHGNATNPFPLADDLMEPLRPLVDWFVFNMQKKGWNDVCPSFKSQVSKFIWYDVRFDDCVTPAVKALERSAFSIVSSYKAKKSLIELPWIGEKQHALPEFI